MKVFYGTTEEYVCCDFFALDYYDDYETVTSIQQYADSIKKLVRQDKNKPFEKIFEIYEHEKRNNPIFVKNSNTLQAGIDNYDFYLYSIKGIKRKSDIFPLIKMKFENTEFWAPNNYHEYLKTIYNHYNTLPIDVLDHINRAKHALFLKDKAV